jgi:hypothetical protein
MYNEINEEKHKLVHTINEKINTDEKIKQNRTENTSLFDPHFR